MFLDCLKLYMDFTRQQQLRQSEDPLLDHALTSIGSGGSHVTEARDWVAAAHLAGAGAQHLPVIEHHPQSEGNQPGAQCRQAWAPCA